MLASALKAGVSKVVLTSSWATTQDREFYLAIFNNMSTKFGAGQHLSRRHIKESFLARKVGAIHFY